MGAVRLLSWWELSDCCLDGRSEIVVFMGATISEFPSGKQSESFHQHNNLTVPIKATL
jgi:hypothetical protein